MIEVDPESVSSAVLSCPSVAAMAGGGPAEVATYLPGRRVMGIRSSEEAVDVHIVARWGKPLPEVGEEVRRAVAPLVGGRAVSVYIDDVELPDEPLTAAALSDPRAGLGRPAGTAQ